MHKDILIQVLPMGISFLPAFPSGEVSGLQIKQVEHAADALIDQIIHGSSADVVSRHRREDNSTRT
ncbi:hypothetical protein N7541_005396 [Penicillium brevicompactum]|uniref:Uncharacterized protein n=1 Tax=Penicillium brevicompactum TaxID=5074 RepID=A0A9W9UUR1_PENBR|nr:hypothetical protein N7541_005396 [Penicillium brevicompactum]